jgi:hypothetical protein
LANGCPTNTFGNLVRTRAMCVDPLTARYYLVEHVIGEPV